METAGFGFPVRACANAFFDEGVARIAREFVEREAHFEAVSQRIELAS